ncbi:MAG: nucleotidyltransferase domain-containing protein [Anaerolineaceae bacterium]|nr:nucleotidyltransferase domain-containing protein [Anaerolineaceae bacterium]
MQLDIEHEKLDEITQRILDVSQPEKIILFGSFARGTSTPNSDLDLLVILKDVDTPRAESNRLRRALRGLLIPIDIIVASPDQIDRYGDAPGLIYRTALKEGVIIYERPPTAS